MNDTEEKILVEKAKKGDKKAFETLVVQYQSKIFGIAYSMLRNKDDALDISQEAFYRAYRSLPDFKGNAKFYTWIYRITINLVLDFIQKRDKMPGAEYDEGIFGNEDELTISKPNPVETNPERYVNAKEMAEIIGVCLEKLSEKHRSVLVLRELEELSYEEIASIMDCSIGTVMSRLHHARNKIRDLLRIYVRDDE